MILRMDKHEHVGCALNFAHTAQCRRSKQISHSTQESSCTCVFAFRSPGQRVESADAGHVAAVFDACRPGASGAGAGARGVGAGGAARARAPARRRGGSPNPLASLGTLIGKSMGNSLGHFTIVFTVCIWLNLGRKGAFSIREGFWEFANQVFRRGLLSPLPPPCLPPFLTDSSSRPKAISLDHAAGRWQRCLR